VLRFVAEVPVDRAAAFVVLNRLAFGPVPGEVDRLVSLGINAWLDEQLNPTDDPECDRRIRDARLRIEYGAGEDQGVKWDAVAEDRPLSSLETPTRDLWHLANWQKGMDYAERIRPREEVRAATLIRAVHSRWQLREVLADFWHNHFNVAIEADHVGVSIAFPVYDREVIRRNCFGNFRAMLEAVATSTPMLLYLNNASSRASPANENFARELFELHTLGAPAYLNHLYNRWRDVPGAGAGQPEGYIDQDVYEAARAFTGWTVGDGQWIADGEELPRTGEFIYHDPWHDPYQKRVLASEFEPNAPPMSDGRRVLDLVAFHPASARYVCTKLVRRLLADDPPSDVVDAAMQTWAEHLRSNDQIARVVRTIATHPTFLATSPGKVKRPLDYAIGALRATGADLNAGGGLGWFLDQMGQSLFGWPTPTGHPDVGSAWLGAGAVLMRWNFAMHLCSGDFDSAKPSFLRQTPTHLRTWGDIAGWWIDRVIGPGADSLTIDVARTMLGNDPDGVPESEQQLVEHLRGMVAMLLISPAFQRR
jgi:uncharacterized protein (DUF1800 family)